MKEWAMTMSIVLALCATVLALAMIMSQCQGTEDRYRCEREVKGACP